MVEFSYSNERSDVPEEISLTEGHDYELEGLTEDGKFIVYGSDSVSDKHVPVERAYAEEELSVAVNIAEYLSEREQQEEKVKQNNKEALTDDEITGVGESLEEGLETEEDDGGIL